MPAMEQAEPLSTRQPDGGDVVSVLGWIAIGGLVIIALYTGAVSVAAVADWWERRKRK